MLAVPDPSSALLVLQSSQLRIEINPQGAELHSLRDRAGRNFLWHGDPAIWAGRAPILFPIVGTLNGGTFGWRGKRYALSRHGFARGSPFEVVEVAPQAATLRLRSSPATLARYPFPFQLDLIYRVEGATLAIHAVVSNDGPESLPASLGFHPGFLWPLPHAGSRDSHWIEFEKEEPAAIRRIDAQGLLSPRAQPSPLAGRRLALNHELFRDDVVILDQFESRQVRYRSDTGPAIDIGFAGARYLGIWSKPGAPFFCVEPWAGITDPAGFTGELLDKPGIFVVEPGQSRSLAMTISLDAS